MFKKILSILTIISLTAFGFPVKASATADCPDLRFIFVRGSGEPQDTSDSFNEFKRALEDKMQYLPTLSYDFVDLNYPAISVAENLTTPFTTFIGSGEMYEFGDSVNAGSAALIEAVNHTCASTKFVLGGYSQGAMVISKTLPSLNADKIIYAATFGDPKIYLPEGEDFFHPAACHGGELSEYRRYVPDCRAYEGILGSYRPYEPEAFAGKVGTWCNKKDIICSRTIIGSSIRDHLSYIDDGLYEDASRYIFNEIAQYFGIENNYVSPHDTAILIDSTGSMASMLEQYKAEALRLANETFAAGGRVALYDFRDLQELYTPRQHCNFETCTPELFASELESIIFENGGDDPESFLSAAYTVMSELNWQQGATKSLVAITDAGFHLPDIDDVDIATVAALSRKIDPVNIYVVTGESSAWAYEDITRLTGGSIATNLDQLRLINDDIMERFDSLPRVDDSEIDETVMPLPVINMIDVKQLDETTFRIHVETDARQLMVFLNEACLGLVDGSDFDIAYLDFSKPNNLRIVPLSQTSRGEPKEVQITDTFGRGLVENPEPSIPLVPNTGRK